MGVTELLPRPVLPARRRQEVLRDQTIGFNDWVSLVTNFSYNTVNYAVPTSGQEPIGAQYVQLGRLAYRSNGVVFACMAVRARLFSEARFMLRSINEGRPGDLHDGSSPRKASPLEILRNPWPNGTTGDLLNQMIQHADLGGNAFVANRGDKLALLRPDWVTIVSGVRGVDDATMWHPDAEVLGYIYQEGGQGGTAEPVLFDVSEVAHFAPIADPYSRWRGMSWLTPVIREVMADKAMTEHKLLFMENAATPQMVVKFDVDDLSKYKAIIEEFRAGHEGSENAYKTLFLNAGTDVTPVGKDLSQIDFKSVQGAGETRIAAASGIHPVIVGLSEGLAGSSLNAGNFESARRLVADAFLYPYWRQAAACLATIVNVPAGSELWYDSCDIAFLQSNEQDAATIQQTQAVTIKQLIDAGFESDSVVEAVTSGDLSLLQHTGLFSVQLQPAGTTPKQGLEVGTPVPTGNKPSGSDTTPSQTNSERDPFEMLSRFLHERVTQPERPINVNVTTPDVNVDVHPPSITVEPTRFDEGTVQVHVDAAPTPDVNVTVEPPAITVEAPRFEEGAVSVSVEAPAAPNVDVTVESPQVTIERGKARRIDFGDGRGATVTEGDVKQIRYDDGREVTITEVDE